MGEEGRLVVQVTAWPLGKSARTASAYLVISTGFKVFQTSSSPRLKPKDCSVCEQLPQLQLLSPLLNGPQACTTGTVGLFHATYGMAGAVGLLPAVYQTKPNRNHPESPRWQTKPNVWQLEIIKHDFAILAQ